MCEVVSTELCVCLCSLVMEISTDLNQGLLSGWRQVQYVKSSQLTQRGQHMVCVCVCVRAHIGKQEATAKDMTIKVPEINSEKSLKILVPVLTRHFLSTIVVDN